jgi:hypothetical protein
LAKRKHTRTRKKPQTSFTAAIVNDFKRTVGEAKRSMIRNFGLPTPAKPQPGRPKDRKTPEKIGEIARCIAARESYYLLAKIYYPRQWKTDPRTAKNRLRSFVHKHRAEIDALARKRQSRCHCQSL